MTLSKTKMVYFSIFQFSHIFSAPWLSPALTFVDRNHFLLTRSPLVRSGLHLDAPPNLPPPDEPPVALDPPAERDLLADAGADGRRQPDLGQVGLDGNDAAAGRQRADVHHEHLRLAQLGNLEVKCAGLSLGRVESWKDHVLTSIHVQEWRPGQTLCFVEIRLFVPLVCPIQLGQQQTRQNSWSMK